MQGRLLGTEKYVLLVTLSATYMRLSRAVHFFFRGPKKEKLGYGKSGDNMIALYGREMRNEEILLL